MEQEKIIVIDFGGQYNQLVARRVRENNVYCEIYSYKTDLRVIISKKPKGIILTGGPDSVYREGAASCSKELFDLGIPVLGLCYGMQLMMQVLGGEVRAADEREYGKTELIIDDINNPIFKGIENKTICWMSHNDYVYRCAPSFKVIAHTANCPIAVVADEEKKLYGFQFHPEVLHTLKGKEMLRNFLYNICHCKGEWKMDDFAEKTIENIRNKVKDGKALCALSGGVDSSVAAILMSKAIGKNLTCVFVDHGLLRKDEANLVKTVFDKGEYDLNFIKVDATDRFYAKLKGINEPEQKRKVIGEEFIRVFEEEAKKIGHVDYLVQGTIYPDVVESGLGGESATIKSHHNVGGLPNYVDFKEIIEPLRDLFKDEVRAVGKHLGLKDELVNRQPFPGPGLGIRIVGEVTSDKVKIVQEADAIFREEITKAGLNALSGQYFAALSNMKTVGVMGDDRTYDYAIVLRAVETIDFMTADIMEIPYDVLKKIMNRIISEVKHVNRVFYDITSKPPGTIELE